VPLVRVTGRRKYGPIWSRLKESGSCRVECSTTEDTLTTINGVKKEKSRDKNKPKDKVLKIDTIDGKNKTGDDCTFIEFKLVIDTSINNL
jgi:hypothetical protein